MAIDKADEYFEMNLKNMILTVENQNYPKFSSFLDGRQRMIADQTLKQHHCNRYCYFGGASESERVMLGIYPDYMERDDLEFPIRVLEFSYRKQDQLTHRDFLGVLMSQQVKRDAIGDILVSEGRAAVFVIETLAEYLSAQIKKIGKIGVTVHAVSETDLVLEQQFQDLAGTVASLRLDAVVAFITRFSRTRSRELIQDGKVTLNYMEIVSPSALLKTGDLISVRGYGKYRLSEDVYKTKKDRYHIIVKKYL